jgi:CRISPR/Cas system-associated exonuclease Cas4 (RecB family)
MAKKRRDYDNDFPSVTTALDVLRKIGLEMWFKVNTPEFIKAESEKGKLIGTQLHEAIQVHIELNEVKIETQYPDEITNALKSFMLFKKEHPEIKLKRAEIKMTSLIYKCNGTMDVDAEIAQLTVPGDWKTGNAKDEDKPKIYDEYIAQLAAYLKFYNELFGKNAKEGFIAVFAKDKVAYNYRLIPAEEIELCFNEIFLPALKVCYGQRALKQLRKGV